MYNPLYWLLAIKCILCGKTTITECSSLSLIHTHRSLPKCPIDPLFIIPIKDDDDIGHVEGMESRCGEVLFCHHWLIPLLTLRTTTSSPSWRIWHAPRKVTHIEHRSLTRDTCLKWRDLVAWLFACAHVIHYFGLTNLSDIYSCISVTNELKFLK